MVKYIDATHLPELVMYYMYIDYKNVILCLVIRVLTP